MDRRWFHSLCALVLLDYYYAFIIFLNVLSLPWEELYLNSPKSPCHESPQSNRVTQMCQNTLCFYTCSCFLLQRATIVCFDMLETVDLSPLIPPINP